MHTKSLTSMLTLKDFGSIEPTFSTNDPPVQTTQFSFISIQDPSDLKDRSKQKAIRRHAKRDYDRSKQAKRHQLQAKTSPTPSKRLKYTPIAAKPETTSRPVSIQPRPAVNPVTLVVQPDQLLGTHHAVESSPDSAVTDETELSSESSSSWDVMRPIGAGRGFNPLASYPYQASERETQLIDYLVNFEMNNRPVSLLWITIAVSDEDALNITLAHASNVMARARDPVLIETAESMSYYTSAVQAMSKRIQRSEDSTSDGVLMTVLGMACLDTVYDNLVRHQAHMEGVKRILHLRGGSKSLKSWYELEMTAFWTDISGCLLLDVPPRLPLPSFAQVSDSNIPSSRRVYQIPDEFRERSPLAASMLQDALESLQSLACQMNVDGLSKSMWEQELFIALEVFPVAFKLLDVPRPEATNNQDLHDSHSMVLEPIRLAGLLMVALLKSHCGIPPSAVPTMAARLKAALLPSAGMQALYPVAQFWTLIVLAVAGGEEGSWAVTELAKEMHTLGIPTWCATLQIARYLPWIGPIMDDTCAAIGLEVEAKLLEFQELGVSQL